MTIAAAPAAPTRSLRLSRAEQVDGGLLLVLTILGLVGFRSTYGGWAFLAVGAIGVVLGMLISHLADRLGQPIVAEGAVTILIFFLLGGALAAPGSALGGLVPTSSTVSSLASAGTHGWKELLTTPAPVGNTSDLLAIPYLVGLLGGVAGASLARRTRVPALPLLAPTGVLAVSILFGLTHPQSLLLQGACFAGFALAWVMLRSERRRVTIGATGRRRTQLAWAAGLLAVAALIGTVAGPELPFSGHRRVVLSRYVVPPFDVNDLPSPLAAFRTYTPGAPHNLAAVRLFTVSGLRPGARVRIATMDSYNGLVWGFGTGAAAGGSGDVFRRYGVSIPTTQPGRRATLAVDVQGWSGVWLPDVGQLTAIRFTGPDAGSLGRSFRYDEATGTGANPTTLTRGDGYRLSVVIPAQPTARQLQAATAATQAEPAPVPPAVQASASQWAGGASGAWQRVTRLASVLRTTGRFSNGTEVPPLSASGHSEGRLDGFVQGGPLIGNQIVGDDEQYAAALALMSDAVGVPARVVLGAVVGRRGVVTGADVHAWVEVALNGLGWVPVDYSSFLPTRAPVKVLPQPQPVNQTQVPVAPPTVSVLQPPPDDVLPQSPAPSAHSLRHAHHGVFRLPGWVVDGAEDLGLAVGAALALAGGIVGAKLVRRRRRRRSGTPTRQIAAAWHELVDQARDAGHRVPAGRTRREQAGHVPGPTGLDLASAADGAIFGPGDPTPEQVDGYWSQVLAAGRALRAGMDWRSRLRAVLNPASLRRLPGGAT